MATTITVDKPLPLLPDIKLPPIPESVIDVDKKNHCDKEWTEPRIHLKDLHQQYLKLIKSRLTSTKKNVTQKYVPY